MYGLVESIRDNLVECFVKLGYTDAPLNFNYPTRTLKTLIFGIDECKQCFTKTESEADENITDEALFKGLTEALYMARDTLGECTVRRRTGGYSITVPREGVKRAFSELDAGGFLPSLLSAISSHGVTSEDIHAVFEGAKRPYISHPSRDPDIDEFITVTDGSDPYIYLFKYEGHHVDYHRLLPADFYEIYGK